MTLAYLNTLIKGQTELMWPKFLSDFCCRFTGTFPRRIALTVMRTPLVDENTAQNIEDGK